MEIDRKIIDSSSEWVSESTKAEDSCQFYFTFIAQKTINLIKFKLIYPLPEKKRKAKEDEEEIAKKSEKRLKTLNRIFRWLKRIKNLKRKKETRAIEKWERKVVWRQRS